jgi:hypothetical protein
VLRCHDLNSLITQPESAHVAHCNTRESPLTVTTGLEILNMEALLLVKEASNNRQTPLTNVKATTMATLSNAPTKIVLETLEMLSAADIVRYCRISNICRDLVGLHAIRLRDAMKARQSQHVQSLMNHLNPAEDDLAD